MTNRIEKLFIFPAAALLVLCIGWAIAAPSPDAIGVRVAPNPKHYSAQRWYQSQGFKGSPQALVVDGYEAIRDGRTVYIDVANIVEAAPANNEISTNDQFFTNIFIISYNQDAEKATEDIFGQILANWKFNNNILKAGTCNQTATQSCIYGPTCVAPECPTCAKGEYCISSHDVSVRDTKRLADLNDLNELLVAYKAKNGGLCPKLESGSYLPNKTISTWPSWQETLGKALGANLPFDPINRMGACAGFNSQTCWNETTRSFADPTPADANFDLPDGSRAYIYMSSPDGRSCSFFVATESGLVCNAAGVCSVGNNLGTPNPFSIVPGAIVVTGASNTPPTIVCGSMSSFPKDPFSGFVSVFDIDRDPISGWQVDPLSPANWAAWQAAGWVWQPGQTSLVFANTAVPNQKKLVAQQGGNTGNYQARVTVSDGISTSSKLCNITMGPSLPIIQALNVKAKAGNYATTTIFGYETNKSYGLTFSMTGDKGSGPIANFLTCTSTSPVVGEPDGKFNCYVNQKITYQPGVYTVTVTGTDTQGDTAMTSFIFDITNTPPRVNSVTCDPVIRALGAYSCTITGVDDEGNAITNYSVVGLPPGLSVTTAGGVGTISGIPALVGAGPHALSIVATDEYGFSGPATAFNLQVNNFCGDGVSQQPNTEGAGGSAAGAEQCDGTDGIAPNPPGSAPNRQYGCTTVGTNVQLTGNMFSGTNLSCGLAGANVTGSCNAAFWTYNFVTPAVSQYFATVETSNWGTSPYGSLETFAPVGGEENVCPQAGVQHHVRVLVDGNYKGEFCANAAAPGGANSFSNVALGPLTGGNHVLRLEWDNDWTYNPDNIWGTADDADSNIKIYTIKVDDKPCPEGGNCAGTCVQFGGYCGDSIVQAEYNENCENSVTDSAQRCGILNTNSILDSDGSAFDCGTLANNTIGQGGIDSLYVALCDSCQIGCQADPNRNKLGMGCYLGQASPVAPPPPGSCQKGVWTCQANTMVCQDVFPSPKFDYCCAGQDNLIKTNAIGPFTIVRADATDLVVPSFVGVYANVGTVFNYYNCDQVCQKVGKVCIGVGLNDHTTNACKSIVHDVGGACSCSNGINQYDDDCKSKFSLAGASTVVSLAAADWGYAWNWVFGYQGVCNDCSAVAGLSQFYQVGETACYCQ
ncbi:hypothetical protein HGA34_03885 [Candidatus Falkowbacteria bacterium]|nr:hypothetical protein [Candidatus Falkowbacteria bacterium]